MKTETVTPASDANTGGETEVATTVTTTTSAIVLLAAQAIKDDQDGIKSDLGHLSMRIHNNAVQCLLHCEIHRDTSLMRRLLMDIVGPQSVGRRQGLINWMHKHSPMVLKGDNINLSGKNADGSEKAFNVKEAAEKPFWTDKANDERVTRPVYVEGPVGKVEAGIREMGRLLANTNADGTPKDASKPYYAGKYADKVQALFNEFEDKLKTLPGDDSKEVHDIRERAKAKGLTVVEKAA